MNDTPTEEDTLGFRPYVEAIAEFLTAKGTAPPITLSIEGQWGCGKSSFMKQLKKEIEKGNETEAKKKKYFTVWFNCWRFEKEDELWAAFALSFMEQLSEQLSWWERQRAKINLVWLRLKFKWKSDSSVAVHVFLRIIYIIGVTFFWLGILYYSPSIMEILFSYSTNDGSVKTITNVLLILTAFVGLMHHLFSFWKDSKLLGNPFDFSKFVRNSNYTEHISFIEHFHSDFNKIIRSYVRDSKVYVFIDDLDRCEAPKAAKLMQALNIMISDDSKVYFSLGMDRKIISAGLAARNKSILRHLSINGLEYGYQFIEKFIQLPFKVPSPKSETFLKLLAPTDENELPFELSQIEESSNRPVDIIFDNLSEGDIKSLHNENEGDYTEVDESTNTVTESNKMKILNDQDCKEDRETSKIIVKMVAPALDNNPRRMKQFINQFRFQKTIGYRTGLFSYDKDIDSENMWNCKKLAKFVAISIKWNSLLPALNSNRNLLDGLLEYELNKENQDRNLDKWIKDEKLLGLLRYGCMDEGNVPKNVNEYSLSGLDFSKLLQISPLVSYLEDIPSSSSFPEAIRDMEFVLIPKGEFMMGSDDYSSEQPVHIVKIENPFYLGKYLVTQKQWKEVMGNNPFLFQGDDLPVENVSWVYVQAFITKLNEMEGTNKYRLPSEAEWEYACRAGATTRYSFGDDESKLGEYGWYDKNSGGKTHPVGLKKPNPWGLYDMHGNVWEWVQDRWHTDYSDAPSDGSALEENSGSYLRVERGGGWNHPSNNCRATNRTWDDPRNRNGDLGFRLLKEP